MSVVICNNENERRVTYSKEEQEKMLDMIGAKEVAQMLRCNYRTVLVLTAKGELPHCRLGDKAIRYRRSDIEKFVLDQIEASRKPKEHATA